MEKPKTSHACYHNIYSKKIHSLQPIPAMAEERKNKSGPVPTGLKDPISALTHMIAAAAAALGTFPLIKKAVLSGNGAAIAAMSIFIASMILLYSASSTYHSLDCGDKINLVLRRIDHAMIFLLIAGSYTPVCIFVLPSSRGIPLLITVWTFAVLGIILKIWIIRCPKWVSSVIYIAMGWLCVLVFGPLLRALTARGLFWLLTGGIIYTAGGIIYGIKPKIFNRLPHGFGNHEIFHIFVMAGSLCHYLFMYQCIL